MRWLWSFVTTMVVSVGLGGWFIAWNGGFGASDLRPLAFWTLPLAALAGFGGHLVARWSGRRPGALPWAVGLLAGAVLGPLWTVAVRILLGPWFGAFSFPVLLCWAAAGATGVIAPVLWQRRGWAASAAAIAIVLLAAVLGAPSVSAWVVGAHTVEVVFVRWQHAGDALVLDDPHHLLTAPESARLQASHLTGRLTAVGSSSTGPGSIRRTVIVMDRQIVSPVELALGDKSGVIYVQTSEGFRPLEPGAHTVNAQLTLKIASWDSRQTIYEVGVAGGVTSGTGMDWARSP